MKTFLTPFNLGLYNALAAYKKTSELDWTIKTKMNIGDEVYFYCSAPIRKILFKGIVTKIDVDYNEMIDDREFYVNKENIKNNNGQTYIRIKITEEFPESKRELLTFEDLKNNGLKGSLQGTRILDNNKMLFDYIKRIDG